MSNCVETVVTESKDDIASKPISDTQVTAYDTANQLNHNAAACPPNNRSTARLSSTPDAILVKDDASKKAGCQVSKKKQFKLKCQESFTSLPHFSKARNKKEAKPEKQDGK